MLCDLNIHQLHNENVTVMLLSFNDDTESCLFSDLKRPRGFGLFLRGDENTPPCEYIYSHAEAAWRFVDS